MKDSRIAWTDHTFNPWIGCTKVSPGCDHCYADTRSTRFHQGAWGKGTPRHVTKTWKAPASWNRHALKTGIRERTFCLSLGDLFVAAGRWEEPDWERTSFEQLAEGLLNDYRTNNRRSLDRLQFSLRHLALAFQGQRIKAKAITSARVTQYKTARQAEGAANGSINRELAALKRALILGKEAKLVRADDIPVIKMLQEPAGRKGFFERDQFEAVRRHLPDHLHALVTCAFLTGWRLKSELLTRTWAHVDFQANWLRLEPGETKNGEGRQFPLIPELRAALTQQREYTEASQKEQGRIIPQVFHRGGKPIQHFRRAWRSACKAAGQAGKIPHDFRRTAVRNLERSGVSRSAGMAMVGHRTMSVYRRYSIVDEGDLKHAGAKLAALGEQMGGNEGSTTGVAPRRVQAKGLTQ
jgi:integrase